MSRPTGMGMSRAVAQKLAAKYDMEKAKEAKDWVEAVTGESLGIPEEFDQDQLNAALKNGQVLCRLLNKINPGTPIKFNTQSSAFKERENIEMYLKNCEKYGCLRDDLFQVVDLFEGANKWAVISGIHSLGRCAQKNGFTGPSLGVKESAANVREFSAEQLKAGQNVIGLQAGTNKGASQAGMSMGKRRMITEDKFDK